MSIIPIGQLKHRLRLERFEAIPDGGGGETGNWQFVADVWAAIEAGSPREIYTASTLQGRSGAIIWIRHRPDVTTNMRFVKDNRVFQIRGSVDVDQQQRFLRVYAEETTE